MEIPKCRGELDKVLVRKILENPHEYEWRYQDIGLLSLRLDEQREFALHVWVPERCDGPAPIHDHPFDFVSTVIAGQMINTRYVEDTSGLKYLRERYCPSDETSRTSDYVLLHSEAETLEEGDHYEQDARELHDSQQINGTVTIIRRMFRHVDELTVCRPEGTAWVSGAARAPTSQEVQAFTAKALSLF